MWSSLMTLTGAVLIFAGLGGGVGRWLNWVQEKMGRKKLPVSTNNSEEFYCQKVQRKWSSSWMETCCQKIFVFIFNERNKNMFLCMVTVLKKGEKLLMQKRGGELLEKYPCGIKTGMGSSAWVWGLALSGSPSPLSRVMGRKAGYTGSGAGRETWRLNM